MKIQNLRIFVCAAFVCGAFCCVRAEAKVCFAGDGGCGDISEFPEVPEVDTEKDCETAGYTTPAAECNNPGGVCPYDSNYVKCCGEDFVYPACVFPNEYTGNKSDKCGNLYRCKCNSDYKSVAQWRAGAGSNCQPGGGICILSNSDTVYYNKCTCDTNYFPYTTSCSAQGLILVETCKDSDNKTYYRCQCPSNFKTCTYGGAVGAKKCQQGGITLYSSCKSPEEECKNAGYYENCPSQKCYFKTNSTERPAISSDIYSGEPIACEDSNEACPYAYGFYKCRWSAANYCAKWNMTEKSAVLPSTCTKEGAKGTVVPCRLGGGENGTGSGKYLGYYRCKLTCDQRLLSKVGSAVTADTRFGYYNGGYMAFYLDLASPKRGFKKGTHLFLRSNFRMPTAGLEYDLQKNGDKEIYAKAKKASEKYASVNGIGALYKLDPATYPECKDEYNDTSKNPTLTIPLETGTDILSRGFTNINILLSYHDDKNVVHNDWTGRQFKIAKESGQNVSTYVWDNINFMLEKNLDVTGQMNVSTDNMVRFYTARTVVLQNFGTKLRFTGKVGFSTPTHTIEGDYPEIFAPSNNLTVPKQTVAMLVFHGDGYHIVEFENATMSSVSSSTNVYYSSATSTEDKPDFDTNSDVAAIFNVDNSTVSVHNIFSRYSLNVNRNSVLRVKRLALAGSNDAYDKNTSGNHMYVKHGKKNCRGAAVLGNSTVYVSRLSDVWPQRYLYVGGGSKYNSDWPIRLRQAGDSVACINGSTSKITSYGTEYTTDFTFPDTTGYYMSPKNATKIGSQRVIYSLGNWACLPYNLNGAYKGQTDGSEKYDNTFQSQCSTGYRSSSTSWADDNAWSDAQTYSTPGIQYFSVYNNGTKNSYSMSPQTRINSWYPMMAGNYAGNYLSDYTCSNRGQNYTRLQKGYCYPDNTWDANLNKYVEVSPSAKWMTSITYYYYRCSDGSNYCSNSSKYSYGCSGQRKFLCSGCSYCESGIGYADWPDSVGGL